MSVVALALASLGFTAAIQVLKQARLHGGSADLASIKKQCDREWRPYARRRGWHMADPYRIEGSTSGVPIVVDVIEGIPPCTRVVAKLPERASLVVERFEIFLAGVPGALFTRADGKATVIWSGIEDEVAVLDAAVAEVVAACRTDHVFGYR